MAQTKFEDGTNITIFEDNYITCSENIIYIKFIYIFFILYLF